MGCDTFDGVVRSSLSPSRPEGRRQGWSHAKQDATIVMPMLTANHQKTYAQAPTQQGMLTTVDILCSGGPRNGERTRGVMTGRVSAPNGCDIKSVGLRGPGTATAARATHTRAHMHGLAQRRSGGLIPLEVGLPVGREVFEAGEGGGLGPENLCTKMARPDFPNGKFRFFSRWSFWSGGGPPPPPPTVHGHSNSSPGGHNGSGLLHRN